jgi:hypothetical protein
VSEAPRASVPRLMDGIDAERGAMREQRRLAVPVESHQLVPEIVFVFGQLLGPLLMAGLDRLGGRAVGESRCLGVEARALGRDFETGPERHPIERTQAERVQYRREGHSRILRQGITQRQHAMRRELGDEPVGQRLETVILLRLRLRIGMAVGADADDGTLSHTGRLIGGWSITAITFDRLDWRLILRTDVAAFDPELTLGVNADKHAGACDLGGIEDDRSFLEGRERCLDLAEPLVDLVGQFVGVCVLLLEPLKLGLQGVTARTLLTGAVQVARDINGQEVLAAYAPVASPNLGWLVLVELPVEEAK